MKSILIVEDDKTLSTMYEDKFKFSGFTVITADDGEQGLQLAFSQQPNIILLDLNLPKITGLDIMEKLRSTTWGKTVPIIILTNLNVDGQELEGVMKYVPIYCLLKANTIPEEVVSKAKEILKI